MAVRVLFRIATALFLVFLGLQLVRPELKNPPVTADLQAPPEIKRILKNSCYDCHSNETTLKWFDQVVPAYWVVASDVKQGRMHLNFSDLGAQPAAKQNATLFEAVDQIQLGAMPPASYTRLHPEAIVTPGQLAALRAYLHPPAPAIPATQASVAAADAQYETWIATGSQPRPVQAAPNGIAFLPDYKNWKPISSTDRFDNQTLRVILGNDVAIQAIAENDINPWPEGTTFAKVAWYQQPDGKGFVRTGEFQQVEFMIKDSKKYVGAAGWGWARWRGTDLKPYGTTPAFSGECIGCHMPMRRNDYVFTIPVNRAALVGDLPSNPLQSKVITSAVNQADSTMWTLFGNDLAVQYTRANSQHNYPPGSMISLVTWKQHEDDRWFGGRIPAAPKSVEFVTVSLGAEHRSSYSYQKFEGTPLKKVSAQEGPTPNQRAAYVLAQRAAVMP
jgi:hypothetical protein